MDKLFFDTNVLLDVLEQRAPWFPESSACLGLARERKVVGAISAISLSDISYIQRGTDTGMVHNAFSRLVEFLEIAPLNSQVVHGALARRMSDIEDGFQLEAAIHWQATHLITRNLKDFAGDFPLQILQPSDYLKSIT
jgi:hypothetical protein